MTEFNTPEEQQIAELLRHACREVRAAPSFKERLLHRLVQEGRALPVLPSRRAWAKPFVWAPAAAVIIALVIVFVTMGLPGQNPGIVAPPPGSTTTTVTTSPDTTAVTITTPPVTDTTVPPLTTTTVAPSTTTTAPPSTTTTLMASTGFLKILVTDAPPQRDVTEINVILSNVQVSMETGEEEDTWLTVFPGSKGFDLIKLRDAGLAELLGEAELETGTYNQIRMDVEIIDAIIDGEKVTMDVNLPSGKLRLVASFEIKAGQTTVVIVDFDADKSLVFKGNDKVTFLPVVKMIVEYE